MGNDMIKNFKTIYNIFHIDWNVQDKRKIFKNLQERDNNYRNIVLSCSRAALIGICFRNRHQKTPLS